MLGLLSGGSMLDGTMDEYSDLDLILVYDPDYRDDVMTGRIHIASGLGHLLSGFTGEHVGEPRLVICLYDDPLLHVDLKFLMPSELEDRIEDPIVLWEREEEISQILTGTAPVRPEADIQWIEDRFWVWIHYSAAKLGRGELYETIDTITFLRGAVLGPLILKASGYPPRGVRKIEFAANAESEELIQTVPEYDARSCYLALMASIRIYRRLRGFYPEIVLRSEAETASVRYLQQVFAAGHP
ncbi:oxalate:formate antiporter [Cohnella sp. JJ-181]|uniref:oxalate:formate antiporter n=1 Tax=Cohnella rhizoplanae TaxID=2974897 RepID=UPI0022FF8946|nr:hypothetical protein COHCIP112018_00807 [Cohnella sp. JJ-181]